MQDTSNESVSRFQMFRYLSHFVARAFLISIFCLMSIFCVVLFCYFGDLLLNSNNSNRSPLFSTYIIVSPSMVPTININDAVLVKRVDNDKYSVGDIITFNSSDINYEGLAVTHRIVSKESYEDESIYTTKGDNNKTIDPAVVKTDAIYGKVYFRIPAIGNIQHFFSKPTNFFLSLLIPAVIFLLYDLFRIYHSMTIRKKI